jgi:hypothetical protein
MELSVSVKKTKTLDIAIGGSVERKDLEGIDNRIVMEIAMNPDYATLAIDFSGASYLTPGIINLIEHRKREAIRDKKAFEIRNAHGRAAETLDTLGVRYFNEF